jgi:hypothetical protein
MQICVCVCVCIYIYMYIYSKFESPILVFEAVKNASSLGSTTYSFQTIKSRNMTLNVRNIFIDQTVVFERRERRCCL